MTTLQLQHFSIYTKVGKDVFRNYISANNKAAVAPFIIPATLLTLDMTALSLLPQQIAPKLDLGFARLQLRQSDTT